MLRRNLFRMVAPLALLVSAQSAVAATLLVTKTAFCGCCKAWVERMKAAGFTVDKELKEIAGGFEEAKADVMAAGCTEPPRLWLNSGLPNPNDFTLNDLLVAVLRAHAQWERIDVARDPDADKLMPGSIDTTVPSAVK